jgi:hypothetical protein
MESTTTLERRYFMAKRNFIDFILASQESEELTQGFLKANSKEELGKFFASMGDYEITAEEIAKIWKIKERLPEVPPWSPGPSPFY